MNIISCTPTLQYATVYSSQRKLHTVHEFHVHSRRNLKCTPRTIAAIIEFVHSENTKSCTSVLQSATMYHISYRASYICRSYHISYIRISYIVYRTLCSLQILHVCTALCHHVPYIVQFILLCARFRSTGMTACFARSRMKEPLSTGCTPRTGSSRTRKTLDPEPFRRISYIEACTPTLQSATMNSNHSS